MHTSSCGEQPILDYPLIPPSTIL